MVLFRQSAWSLDQDLRILQSPFSSFKDILYPLHQRGVDQMPKESPGLMLTKSSWGVDPHPPALLGVSFKEAGSLDCCGHADLG